MMVEMAGCMRPPLTYMVMMSSCGLGGKRYVVEVVGGERREEDARAPRVHLMAMGVAAQAELVKVSVWGVSSNWYLNSWGLEKRNMAEEEEGDGRRGGWGARGEVGPTLARGDEERGGLRGGCTGG